MGSISRSFHRLGNRETGYCAACFVDCASIVVSSLILSHTYRILSQNGRCAADRRRSCDRMSRVVLLQKYLLVQEPVDYS